MNRGSGEVKDRTLRCEFVCEFEGADEFDEGSVLADTGAGVGVREGLVMIVPWPLAA
jgi:hypothetical protein